MDSLSSTGMTGETVDVHVAMIVEEFYELIPYASVTARSVSFKEVEDFVIGSIEADLRK